MNGLLTREPLYLEHFTLLLLICDEFYSSLFETGKTCK